MGDKEDVKNDDRFKKVLNDPRFKTYKPVKENVELDKRFEKVLNQKKFEIDDDLFHKAESSSSDESSSDEEEIDVDSLDEWEEEDKSCYKDDVEETNRIAVCNLDWDRINSTDIYILLNSFKPADGHIKSVKIYPSEYGKERLAEERIKGPRELTDLREEDVVDEKQRKKTIGPKKSGIDDDEELNKNGFIKNKLRKYQINRLRYYYAVVEFDSVKTAVSVYEQLDGFEYLNSSVSLDLRFIPNGMDFDDNEIVNQCSTLPDLHFYKAPEFINTALQQTKVRLTWEETNHDMSKKLVKAFEDIDNNKEVDYLDEYLASDTENEQDSLPNSDYDSDESANKQNKIEKYKNLLKSIEEEEEKAKQEKKKFDIEIEWSPEIDNKYDDSDDEIELDEEEKEAKLKKEKRDKYRKSKKYKKSNKVSNSTATNNSELDLITMEGKEDKKHFNYENYVENSKKVNKKKREEKVAKDEFKFDTEDPRFKEIYDSPLFNIDPSNPKFKRTKAMSDVIQKKIRKN